MTAGVDLAFRHRIPGRALGFVGVQARAEEALALVGRKFRIQLLELFRLHQGRIQQRKSGGIQHHSAAGNGNQFAPAGGVFAPLDFPGKIAGCQFQAVQRVNQGALPRARLARQGVHAALQGLA